MTNGPRRGRSSSLTSLSSKRRSSASHARSRSLPGRQALARNAASTTTKRPGKLNKQRLTQALNGFSVPTRQVADGYSLDSAADGYQRTALWQSNRGPALLISNLQNINESTSRELAADVTQMSREGRQLSDDNTNTPVDVPTDVPVDIYVQLDESVDAQAENTLVQTLSDRLTSDLPAEGPENRQYTIESLGNKRYKLTLITAPLTTPAATASTASPLPTNQTPPPQITQNPSPTPPLPATNRIPPTPLPDSPPPTQPASPPTADTDTPAIAQPPNRPVMKAKMGIIKVLDRGPTSGNPPTILDQQAQIFAHVRDASAPEPSVLAAMRSRYRQLPPTAGDDLAESFNGVGAFVRKIGDPGSTENPVTKDLTRMKNNAAGGDKASKPILLPAAFVRSQVPINLTNAGGNIIDSSGVLLRASTQMAPSTKEHNKSARLANILKGDTTLTEDQWSGIVRLAVEEKGGKSFDNVADLSRKLQSMDDRRLGNIPDLSNSELLVELFTFAEATDRRPDNDIISPSWFLSILEAYTFNNGEPAADGESPAGKPLPQYIRDNLVDRILVEMEDNDSNKLSTNLNKLTEKVTNRQVRDHSIYTRDTVGHSTYFQGFKPAARYYLPPAERQQLQSGEKSEGFYDGSSFRTTEALLLPSDEDVAGIYVNTHSSKSLLQAIYIANEFFAQTGRSLPLFTYESQTRTRTTPQLTKISLDDTLSLMKTRLAAEAEVDAIERSAARSSQAAELSPVALLERALGRDLTPEEKQGQFKPEEISELATKKDINFNSLPAPFNRLLSKIRIARLTALATRSQTSTAIPPQAPPKKRKPETIPEGWPGAGT